MTLNQTYKLFNFLVILVLVFAILYVLIINVFEFQLTCQNKLNNIPCDNCRVTRGLFEFFRFNFSGSLDHNPKSLFLGILIFFQLIVRGIGILKLKSLSIDSFFSKIIMIEIISFVALMVTYKWI